MSHFINIETPESLITISRIDNNEEFGYEFVSINQTIKIVQENINICCGVDLLDSFKNKLDELNIKTLTKLILNPSWEVIKSVGFCDEASRGSSHFNKQKFEEKILRAEAKVKNIGGTSSDAMRKTVKKYIG